MAWTAPRTWVVGAVLTAGQLNTDLRDNSLDLDRRTTSTAATVATSQTETNTAYDDMATVGPAVTVTIGSTGKALVVVYGLLVNDSVQSSFMGYAVSGATTVAAADARSVALNATVAGDAIRTGATFLHESLNAGSTTFTAKYRVSGGTGTFSDRHIIVTPLGS